jgi:GNAT superfamily N-acetyltransferase
MLVPGAGIEIRELGAGDEEAIGRLLGGLDPESRRRRWFTAATDIQRAADWAAHPDRCCAVGLLALAGAEPFGHGVLVCAQDGRGELAFEVAAPWRHHGIAGALLVRLVDAALKRGLREVYAEVLTDNADMLAVLREYGPHVESRQGGVITVTVPVAAEKYFGSAPPAR